jgi:hypothetical protein
MRSAVLKWMQELGVLFSSAQFLYLVWALVFALGAVDPSFAQATDTFPAMEVENLKGEVLQLPSNLQGSFAFIGVATTKQAEEELRSWQRPVYNKFIEKTGLMDQMWSVEVHFIPVFTGASKAAKASVVKKLRENNEKLVTEHLLIYSGDKKVLEELDIEDKKAPNFYLLNAAGKVIWKGSGAFRQKYLDEIEGKLSE